MKHSSSTRSKKRIRMLVLIGAFLSGSLSTNANFERVNYKLEKQAFDHLENGEYEQSVIIYENILAAEPDNPEYLFNLGIAYYHSFRYSSALQSFEKAILLSIENPEFQAIAEYNIGNTLAKQAMLYADDSPQRTLDYLLEAASAYRKTLELIQHHQSAQTNLETCLAWAQSIQQNLTTKENSDSQSEQSSQENGQTDASEEPSSDEKGNEGSEDFDKKETKSPNQDPSPLDATDSPRDDSSQSGSPTSKALNLQEALLFLDSIENGEKRITLSELLKESTKSSYESQANW